MRRTRGTGCITQMKTGKYKYRGLLRVGINKNGKPKNKIFYGNTKKEVEDKMLAFKNQDMPLKKANIVFNDALDLLYTQSQKERVKQKTLSIIETTSKILGKKWGEYSVDNILLSDVEQQFEIWENIYSFSQLQKIRNYGKKAFRLICNKYELNLRNPFELKLKAPDEAPRLNYFSEEEIYLINDKMDGVYSDIPLFLYETGLRVNECLALKFSDVDYENNVIRVEKTLSETKQRDGKYRIIVTSPKTKLSYRMVPMTEKAYDIIMPRDQGYAKPDDLVFPSGNKTYLSARNVLRAFDNAITKAGVSKNHRGLHSIRHSCVIRLFKEMSANGRSREIDAIDISKIIGNHVDVAAYIYDLEQIDRANRIRTVLENNRKNSFTAEPKIHSGFSEQMIEDLHIGNANDDTEAALEFGKITYQEKELYKKYAFRCYKYIIESETLDYPIAANQLSSNTELWNRFKKTGKLDTEYIASISDKLTTYEEMDKIFKERKSRHSTADKS